MSEPLRRRAVGLGLGALLACGAFAQDPAEEPPRDVGLTEEVEVELVLVDFLVVDRDGNNVPGLTAADFKLKVAGRKTPIASVDSDCVREGSPRSGGERATAETTGDEPAEPPKLLLVFDYFHITNVPETIDRALAALDRWSTGNEIHTVISLGRAVRVEAPPTRNVGDVRWALQRMRNDPDLYAENHASLTQYRFFDRMKALFDLVEQTPGRKSIVLFSGPFQNDAFLHDNEYTELSGLSTSTRSSIYPVDAGGLRTDFDPGNRPLGGPLELRRLANNTGGRVTADTNDIGLAYARAQSDLRCTYTLGYYNTERRLDKKRRLTLKVQDPEMRVIYPEFYLERSPRERHKSMFTTATMAPHMFESDRIAAELFVLGPDSPSSWRGLLAVEVRLGPAPEGGAETDGEIELRGFLRKPNGTIVRDFKKKLPRPPGNAPALRFFEEVEVEPGRYVASAVLSDPAEDTPIAATSPVELVRVPTGSPFLVGPILGRAAEGANRGDDAAFEPLLASETDHGESLQTLTLVCVSGARDAVEIEEVARSVTTLAGATVEAFSSEAIRLPGGKTECHRLVDTLETSKLDPGLYEVSARARTADQSLEGRSVEFTVQHGAPF